MSEPKLLTAEQLESARKWVEAWPESAVADLVGHIDALEAEHARIVADLEADYALVRGKLISMTWDLEECRNALAETEAAGRPDQE